MNAMSDATRERYLYQDCALLALAISDLTGWPCVLISEGPDDDPDVRHVLVRMPDGRLLDVDGPHGDYRDEEPWVAADWGLAEADWRQPDIMADAAAVLAGYGLAVPGRVTRTTRIRAVRPGWRAAR